MRKTASDMPVRERRTVNLYDSGGRPSLRLWGGFLSAFRFPSGTRVICEIGDGSIIVRVDETFSRRRAD